MRTKLIAEIGWNHMGDIELAKKMIYAAKQSGAEWAKFQTWSVQRLSNGAWDLDGRREIYERAELTRDMHVELIAYCKEQDIRFMSSVFSQHDAALLKSLGVKDVKIPSFEMSNQKLLRYCQDSFDLIIISTGASTEEELNSLKRLINEDTTIVLHCVSAYPCELNRINLPRLAYLKQLFRNVGFSDHCAGITASVFSLQYEPLVLEKHFTVDHGLPGRDNKFAILPQDFRSLHELIESYSFVQTDHGIDCQDIEMDARNNYRGRFNQ